MVATTGSTVVKAFVSTHPGALGDLLSVGREGKLPLYTRARLGVGDRSAAASRGLTHYEVSHGLRQLVQMFTSR
jgi:hypothetical protein